MTKPIFTLFWKEYRQQRVLVVALLLFSLMIQLSMCMIAMMTPSQANHTAYFSVAMFMTALYAAGAAAILFVNEHEERTFTFLRSLPISGVTILIGKLSWLFASTLFLGVLSVFGSLIWIPFTGSVDEPGVIFGVSGVAIIEAICWGLFWSPRCKSQLHSLLATFTCASVGAYAVTLIHHNMFGDTSNTDVVPAYAAAALFRLGLALPIGVIGLISAKAWIQERITVRVYDDTKSTLTITQLKSLRPTRGEFRWLLWHTFKQSWGMLLYGIVAGMVTLSWLIANLNRIRDEHYFFLTDVPAVFLALFGVFTTMVFCGSVFASDQKHKAAAMLMHKGVSPGKIWWSRIMMFGIPYFVLGIILFLFSTQITYQYANGEFVGYAFRNLLVLFAWTFCFGQFFSQLIRSPILAIVCTGMMFVPLFLWTIFVWGIYQFSPMWTTLPILLGVLVASRLHVTDWLKGRSFMKCWKKLVLPIMIPMLSIFFIIPIVRVYSVPYVYLGYHSTHPGHGFNFKMMIDNTKQYIDIVQRGREEPAMIPFVIDYWKNLQQSYRNPANTNFSVQHRWFESEVYYTICACVINPKADEADLRKVIDFLETTVPRDRSTLMEQVRWSYHYDRYITLYDSMQPPTWNTPPVRTPFWYRVFLPWEKQRMLRILSSIFQVRSQHAVEVENSVFYGVGDYSVLVDNEDKSGCRIFSNGRSELLEGVYYQNYQLDQSYLATKAMQQEITRRTSLITLALYGWYKEHGAIPETLDVLKGTWLKEIPLIPYYNESFGYYPHPDGTEIEKLGVELAYHDAALANDPTIPFLYTVYNPYQPWRNSGEVKQTDQGFGFVHMNRIQNPGDCIPLMFTVEKDEP